MGDYKGIITQEDELITQSEYKGVVTQEQEYKGIISISDPMTAVERIADFYGSGATLQNKVKDVYAGLYSFKKLVSSASECLKLQRQADNNQQIFNFIEGLIDVAGIEGFLDVNLIRNSFGWIDSNSDGLADYWLDTYGTLLESIVTGNGFSGNAQRMQYESGVYFGLWQEPPFVKGKVYFISLKYRTSKKLYVLRSAVSIIFTLTINIGDASYYSKTEWEADANGYFHIWSSHSLGFGAGDWFEVDEITIQEKTPSIVRYMDSSGNNNTLIQSTESNRPFYFNMSIKYDGVDDILSAGNIGNIKGISFWINPTATQDVWDFDGGVHTIKIVSNTVVADGWSLPVIYVNDAQTSTITTGVWQMVTVMSDTDFTASDFKNFISALELRDILLYKYKLNAEDVSIIFNYTNYV